MFLFFMSFCVFSFLFKNYGVALGRAKEGKRQIKEFVVGQEEEWPLLTPRVRARTAPTREVTRTLGKPTLSRRGEHRKTKVKT